MTGAVVIGIVYVIRNGLRWKDAPRGYGPRTRRSTTASCGGVERLFEALVGDGPQPERIMIDATHLKAHRTAASLPK